MPAGAISSLDAASIRQPGLSMMTRILITDDHGVVRSGLRTVLEGQPNWEAVAKAAVAGLLNINLKTVETHRATVMRKLNLSASAISCSMRSVTRSSTLESDRCAILEGSWHTRAGCHH